MTLDALPLTANGKLDRAALARHAHVSVSGGTSRSEEHASDVERIVSEIFADVLGGPASTDTDVLRLGGNSLHALRIACRCAEALSVDVSVEDVLRHRTPAAIAIAVAGAPPRLAAVPRVAPDRRTAPTPLSPHQRALWLECQMLGRGAEYNIGFLLEVDGRLDHARLEHALAAVIARHEALRACVRTDGGEPHFLVQPPERSVVIDRASAGDGTQARSIARELTSRPIDPAESVPWRAVHIETALRSALCVVVHHVVFDGTSRDVFVRDLVRAYQHGGLPVETGAVDLIDVNAWEIERHSLEADALNAFWSTHGPGPDVVPAIPSSARARAVDACLCESHGSIDPAIAERVRAAATTTGSTRFEVLLTAFLVTLRRAAGADDLLVTIPTDLRDVPGIEEVIGYAVGPVALTCSLAGDESFQRALEHVTTSWRSARRHARLPLDAAAAAAGRRGGQSPFQVFFAYRSPDPVEIAFDGRPARLVELAPDRAKAAIVLFVEDSCGQTTLRMETRRDVLDETAAARFLKSFVDVLQTCVRDPQIGLDELPLLGATPPPTESPTEVIAARPRSSQRTGRAPSEALISIWTRVLGVRNASPTGDFFELGGNSVQAVRLAAEVERAFERRFDFAAFLRNPTLDGISAALESDAATWSCLPRR